ncbi:MAG: transposase [Ktedonobacteraceae bacterium]|nr:transposase [Ktedonobacteraceae bacterium]
MVPLDLVELRILKQDWQEDGRICLQLIARATTAHCPRCQQESQSIHDCRARCKRDLPLRGYQVQLVLWKRRFRCHRCRKTFTEPDTACGWRRRTTARLRESLGQQACSRPIATVALEAGVGPRFVQACWQSVAGTAITQAGGQVEEAAPLPTPRFLGIDEFAVRKGHRYETILCDLERRRVLEVSPWSNDGRGGRAAFASLGSRSSRSGEYGYERFLRVLPSGRCCPRHRWSSIIFM